MNFQSEYTFSTPADRPIDGPPRHLFAPGARPQTPEEPLEAVLSSASARLGVDLRGYRLPMLGRRVRNRMLSLQIARFDDYLALLEREPAEASRLLGTITIKVSEFFRDRAAFELLATRVAPELAVAAELPPLPSPPLIWSAGCGHGEEAYSLALLLMRLLPGQGSPAVGPLSPLVLATDIDALALARARAGRFRSQKANLPWRLAAGLWESAGADELHFRVVAEAVRQRVVFCRHDLMAAQEAPDGGRFSLICCRNVMIYMVPEVQQRIQHLLLRSLQPGGYLCLGEAEWLSPALQDEFDVIDARARLFQLRRVTVPGPREVEARPPAARDRIDDVRAWTTPARGR